MVIRKRLIFGLLLCLAGLVLAAGCTQKNAAQNSPATGTNQSGNSNQGALRQSPDIFGQVKTVSGSDITIAVAQMPQRNQNQSGQKQQNQSSTSSSSTSAGTGQRGNRTLQLTGVTTDVTIPTSAKIYGGGGPGGQNQGQSQGQSPKVITLNDIKAGDMVSVYYTAGTTTIDHIMVRSGAGTGAGAQQQ